MDSQGRAISGTSGSWGVVVICVLLLAGVYGYLLNVTVGGYDFQVHARIAYDMALQERILVPHFVYHLLLLGVKGLLSLSFRQATLLIMLGSSLLLWGLLFAYYRRTSRSLAWGALAALALLFLNPIQALQVVEPDGVQQLYFGYHYLNVFHSPTMMLLKPVAFAGFWLLIESRSRQSPMLSGGAYLVLILSCFVKPSFAMCVVPAALALWGYRWWRLGERDPSLLIAGLVSVSTLAGQYLLYRQFAASTEAGRGIVFSPFTVMGTWSEHLLLKCLLSLVLVVALVGLRPGVLKEKDFQFASLLFLSGAGYAYLFAETGKDAFAGNFIWCAQIGLFVLFAVALKYVVAIARGGGETTPRARVVLGAVFAAHLAGGLAWMVYGLPFNM